MSAPESPNVREWEQRLKAFEYAVSQLRAEATSFWQVSVFFWGFSAAAFVGYANLADRSDKELAVVLACFGLVCSVAWALANRSNKNWNDLWLKKVQDAERAALGTSVFSDLDNKEGKRLWWGAWRYSITKLAMALSDFTVLVWAALLFKSTAGREIVAINWDLVMPVAAILYILTILVFTRSRRPPQR